MRLEKVWVFSESADTIGDICAAGWELGNSVAAVVIGNKEKADKAVSVGASKVYLLESAKDHIFEDYFYSLQKLVSQEKPNVILCKASKKMRLMAGRLAAAFGSGVITDVTKLWLDDKAVVGEHMVYGGAAMRIEKNKSSLGIVLVGEGVFEPLSAGNCCQGTVVPVEYVQPPRRARFVESRPKAGESVNLTAAKRVVGIGRGLAKQEDLKLVEDFARAVQAEIGCSRPIAEGMNWMARERYIGVSGAMLKPDVYFAVGLSGQVQHMVGVQSAKTIIAINKDKNAPIFKQADYGIVGDLYTVLPKLAQKLSK
jgi:electron transfer flavoprotein alpha subunit